MDVIIAKNYSDMSRKAAMIFLNNLALKPNSVFGFATGSTPLGMYDEIVQNTINFSYDFAAVKTFNLDEYYGLPLAHPENYFQYMFNHLFKHLNFKKNNIHFPVCRNGKIQACAQEYEKLIRLHPIDIQLLGIGENGHIGFNEPGSSVFSVTRLVKLSKSALRANARFFNHPKNMPVYALTMGIASILLAKKILILASGRLKAAAVRAMLEGKISARCPASFLREHPQVTAIIDEEAACLLKRNHSNYKTGWSDLRILNQSVLPKGKKILVVSPHHDDSAVSAGATIKALSGQNKVYTLVMTGGYRAQINSLTKRQKIILRNKEARIESGVLGANLILEQFRFYDDGKKFWRGDLLKFSEVFRRIKPDILLLPHRYDEHPTHRLSTELVLDYLNEKKKNGLSLWFYEGLWSQHILDKIDIVFCYGEPLMHVKKKALRAHTSQIKRLPILKAAEALAMFRAKTIPEQRMVSYGSVPPKIGNYAEVYHMEENF